MCTDLLSTGIPQSCCKIVWNFKCTLSRSWELGIQKSTYVPILSNVGTPSHVLVCSVYNVYVYVYCIFYIFIYFAAISLFGKSNVLCRNANENNHAKHLHVYLCIHNIRHYSQVENTFTCQWYWQHSVFKNVSRWKHWSPRIVRRFAFECVKIKLTKKWISTNLVYFD